MNPIDYGMLIFYISWHFEILSKHINWCLSLNSLLLYIPQYFIDPVYIWYSFHPAALKGSKVLSSGGRQGRQALLFFFFIVHRKRIHRVHIRHNLIQATHCYVNTYHNGYTIHVLPYFLVHIYIYIYTHIHTHMYRHSHVSIYTYTHIYIFKPEVFFNQWRYCT